MLGVEKCDSVLMSSPPVGSYPPLGGTRIYAISCELKRFYRLGRKSQSVLVACGTAARACFTGLTLQYPLAGTP